jgi:hypothetical protein
MEQQPTSAVDATITVHRQSTGGCGARIMTARFVPA